MNLIVIVILVWEIIDAHAGCIWNFGAPGTECLMQCISSNTTAVNKEIEDKWNDVEVKQML